MKIINKLTYKNYFFWSEKDPVERMQRQAIDLEKIFANHIYDKRFISRICKELSKFTVKKTTKVENEQKIQTHFTEVDIQLAKKHMTSRRKWELTP